MYKYQANYKLQDDPPYKDKDLYWNPVFYLTRKEELSKILSSGHRA